MEMVWHNIGQRTDNPNLVLQLCMQKTSGNNDSRYCLMYKFEWLLLHSNRLFQ